MRNAKYLIISISLHVLFILLISLQISDSQSKSNSATSNQQNGQKLGDRIIVPKITEISITEQTPTINGSGSKPKHKQHKKHGFYGIGVYIEFDNPADSLVTYQGAVYQGYKIRQTVAGYPAEKIGLQQGDIIFMVDHVPFMGGDIIGKYPRTVVLTVKRGDSVFDIKITGDWIDTN